MKNHLDNTYIHNFLDRVGYGVLSTVQKNGHPDAAPIYFVIKKDFAIYFVTSTQTQKYFDLSSQKHVVLTVTDEKTKETLRLRGKAVEESILLSEVFSALENRLIERNGPYPVIPLMENTGQKTVLRIMPTEIRMRHYTSEGLEEGTITDFKEPS